MNNIIIICQKELKSYFVSPIAYGLMAFFALTSGYVLYSVTAWFVQNSMQSQMMGRQMPMNINEQILRHVLGNMNMFGASQYSIESIQYRSVLKLPPRVEIA